MSNFNEREKAFEDKAAHDAELQFKIEARRNLLVGLWAAEKLGIEGEEAEKYARTVVAADLEEPGFDDVVRKIFADFQENDVEISKEDIAIQLEKTEPEARKQIMG